MPRFIMANTIVKYLFLSGLFHEIIKYEIIFDSIANVN